MGKPRVVRHPNIELKHQSMTLKQYFQRVKYNSDNQDLFFYPYLETHFSDKSKN